MHVLAIEPYYGGSHLAFLDGWISHSRHDWTLATLPARHWKWRMRSAPLAIFDAIENALPMNAKPDAVVVSDMLDLAAWIGLASRQPRFQTWLPTAPIVTYFHENQWAYPDAPQARSDHHFAFTNLITAAASDACWFNSEFNRRSFFDLSRDFLRRMPDSRKAIDLNRIEQASGVFAPGFRPPRLHPQPLSEAGSTCHEAPLRIGWVGRFEHDKRPDRFVALMDQLNETGLPFELILLGQRGRPSKDLDALRARHGHRIVLDGFVESRQEYERQLAQIDVVVSTADHEFFGIAICEAVWAGALPVAPDGLSYVEYVPDALRYESLDQAAQIITRLAASREWATQIDDCRNRIAPYRIELCARRLDDELSSMIRAI